METRINLSRKRLKIDVLIAISLVVLPILFYVYKLVPQTEIWKTSIFEINSNYYSEVQTYIWAMNTKLLMLAFLIIWFLTCRHWWKFFLLLPIILELHKFLNVLNDNLQFFDEFEFYTSLPYTTPVILFLIYLSKKTNYYSLTQSVNSEMEEEIHITIEKIFKSNSKKFNRVKDKFRALKRNKLSMKKDEYLRELVHLKNELMTD